MGRKSTLVKHIEEEGAYRAVREGNDLRIYKKPGVSGHRIKTEDRFASTRLRNAEFKECAAAGKLLRQQLSPLLGDIKDKGLAGRVLKLMHDIQDTDPVPSGYKLLATHMETEAAKELLKGFNFLSGSPLDALLLQKPQIIKTGIYFKAFVCTRDLCIPTGATHAELQGGWIFMDLMKREAGYEFSKAVRLPLNDRVRRIHLKVPENEVKEGICFYVLKLSFYLKTQGLRGDGAVAVAIVKVV
jgi:hypothetical protein